MAIFKDYFKKKSIYIVYSTVFIFFILIVTGPLSIVSQATSQKVTPKKVIKKKVIKKKKIKKKSSKKSLAKKVAPKKTPVAIPVTQYSKQRAQVRMWGAEIRSGLQTSKLSLQEQKFLGQRLPHVRQQLAQIFPDIKEQIMNLSDENTPRIAVAGSGGAFRAMFGFLGFLEAFQAVGFLDTTTYLAGVSGSTWALGAWYSLPVMESMISGAHTADKNYYLNLKEANKELFGLLDPQKNGHVFTAMTSEEFNLLHNKSIFVKQAFRQEITYTDFMGGAFSNSFFKKAGNQRHQVYLSDQSTLLINNNGRWPMPFYAAVYDIGKEREWLTFTPFEVEIPSQSISLPIWAFGRPFSNGLSTNVAPEQSLGYYMALFGSGISGSFKTVPTEFKSRRMSPYISNFLLQNRAGSVSGNYVSVHDAGGYMNLPYPALTTYSNGRQVDCYIYVNSGTGSPAGTMSYIKNFAISRQLTVPDMSVPELQNSLKSNAPVVIIDDKKPHTPVFVYVSLAQDTGLWNSFMERYNKDKKSLLDPSSQYYFGVTEQELDEFVRLLNNFNIKSCMENYCEFSNTVYTYAQAQQLATYLKWTVLSNKHLFKQAIKQALNKKLEIKNE